jgi:hypothetical protein
MSTSLASIDSEGSWLSGKIGAQRSVQQLSPLRSSASSLRRRYQDLEGDVAMGDDEYFTASKDEDDVNEKSQLNLEDSEDEEASVTSEDERNMWRQGTEKRVQLASPTRAMSRQAILDAFDDELQSSSATPAADEEEEYFATPFENPDPFNKTTTPEFQTPLEHPKSYHAM